MPLLSHRDIVGYAAARNTRVLSRSLTEYTAFRDRLVEKYERPAYSRNALILSQKAFHSLAEREIVAPLLTTLCQYQLLGLGLVSPPPL